MPAYPAGLDERVHWNGRDLHLRAIREEDDAEHRAFVEHLAPEDLRLRFFSSRRGVPEAELAHLAHIDYAHEMAFVAVQTRADGSQATLGVVRAFTDAENREAEFGIIVASDLHGQGLGALLLGKLIRYQRHRGTQRLVCDVLRENMAMRTLASNLGFRAHSQPHSEPSIHYVLELASAV